jgi:hypothetical protein
VSRQRVTCNAHASSCSCGVVAYLQSAFRPDLFSDGYLDPSLQRSDLRPSLRPRQVWNSPYATDRSQSSAGNHLPARRGTCCMVSRATTPEGQEHGSTACPVAKDSTAVYLQPPPPYPPICGSNARSLGHTQLSEECFPVRDPILDYRLHCLCKVRPQVLDTAEHLAEPFPKKNAWIQRFPCTKVEFFLLTSSCVLTSHSNSRRDCSELGLVLSRERADSSPTRPRRRQQRGSVSRRGGCQRQDRLRVVQV